jgi:hypothetical protein
MDTHYAVGCRCTVTQSTVITFVQMAVVLAKNFIRLQFDGGRTPDYYSLTGFDTLSRFLCHMPFLFYLETYFFSHLFRFLDQVFRQLTRPARSSLLLGAARDLALSKAELIAENALLRQQLIVLHRHVKKPHLTRTDRLWFLILAARLSHWKEALLIFQPETLLHWHRQGFRLFWKVKSHNHGGRPRLSVEAIALI